MFNDHSNTTLFIQEMQENDTTLSVCSSRRNKKPKNNNETIVKELMHHKAT